MSWREEKGVDCLLMAAKRGFVVCEKGERTTFEEKSEMFDRKESGQEFSVKSGIAGFCGGKFFGEKGKGLPRTICFLLEDSSHMGI